MIALRAAWASDKGRQRASNEDAACVDLAAGLFAVADGVGGRPAGEAASRLAIDVLVDVVRRRGSESTGEAVLDLLRDAVDAANLALRARGEGDPTQAGLATTLTACLVRQSTAHFAHIGDSRAYLVRAGRAIRLTEDHASGQIRQAPAAAGQTEHRRLLAALGMAPWAGADLFTVDVSPADRLVMCTDGLTAEVAEDELAAVAAEDRDPAARCAALVALANARGGQDNVTIVLADVVGER